MNQDILFADIQTWDSERQAVNFPAQQGGALINCWVSRVWLENKCGQALADEAAVLDAFSQCRFDLEDIAENLIEDEDFNQDGDIEIN
ncbi:DUF1488 domain-containing protein [Photobacterium sp. BZF1]|uniref:DUF1488 domain-containing protein n=1 Tax=Photobacterium rosenbergii TaxID=294936 RepID=A0A2T3MWZ7_9GAMM|nr:MULTISPECIES: DUF1488 domain-containing protein [Photobacterium]MBC7006539.1 DUF1488 domain-containing protein [Photobacterium sp. BZF1]MBY5949303.1 DUF1488 domain-containing protein [Photobacterium rosenbergii]PSW04504.1 DUF1488 domain-containing protein [Photobacterium rosenbergii]